MPPLERNQTTIGRSRDYAPIRNSMNDKITDLYSYDSHKFSTKNNSPEYINSIMKKYASNNSYKEKTNTNRNKIDSKQNGNYRYGDIAIEKNKVANEGYTNIGTHRNNDDKVCQPVKKSKMKIRGLAVPSKKDRNSTKNGLRNETNKKVAESPSSKKSTKKTQSRPGTQQVSGSRKYQGYSNSSLPPITRTKTSTQQKGKQSQLPIILKNRGESKIMNSYSQHNQYSAKKISPQPGKQIKNKNSNRSSIPTSAFSGESSARINNKGYSKNKPLLPSYNSTPETHNRREIASVEVKKRNLLYSKQDSCYKPHIKNEHEYRYQDYSYLNNAKEINSNRNNEELKYNGYAKNKYINNKQDYLSHRYDNSKNEIKLIYPSYDTLERLHGLKENLKYESKPGYAMPKATILTKEQSYRLYPKY